MTTTAPVAHRAHYILISKYFRLEMACRLVAKAYGDGFGCYLVGSSLTRPDWRDVDVRCILRDEEYATLFPGGEAWDDSRASLLAIAISMYLSQQSDLPVDFQFQAQSKANAEHKGPRNSIGWWDVRLERHAANTDTGRAGGLEGGSKVLELRGLLDEERTLAAKRIAELQQRAPGMTFDEGRIARLERLVQLLAPFRSQAVARREAFFDGKSDELPASGALARFAEACSDDMVLHRLFDELAARAAR